MILIRKKKRIKKDKKHLTYLSTYEILILVDKRTEQPQGARKEIDMIEYKITFTKDGFKKTANMSGYGVESMMLIIIKENYEDILSAGFEITKDDRPIKNLIACFPSLYRPIKGSYPCVWKLKSRPQWSKVKEDLDLL